MSYIVVCIVSAVASGLTFFSGFGLGTLLLPAMALFFPIEHAVAMTAVVHFLNGLFKLWLVRRDIDRGTVLVFGLPAIAAALAGAWVLQWMAGIPPLTTYRLIGRDMNVSIVKLAIGILLLVFVVAEMHPRFSKLKFERRFMPLGGLLSGFFGGLSGMQGALRSAFLSKAGLTKKGFIATGAAIACLIDISRLGVYARSLWATKGQMDWGLLLAAVIAAFIGAWWGSRYLEKVTLRGVQRIVAVMLAVVAVGLIAGVF